MSVLRVDAPEAAKSAPAPTRRKAPGPWSARRWRWSLAAVLALHLGLLWFLGERPVPLPSPQRFEPRLHLAADPWTAQRVAQLPTLTDPTLFALPSRQGFSGPAWLDFAPLRSVPWEWSEPARWLAVPMQALGHAFLSLAATSSAPPLQVADLPTPRVVGLASPVPPVPLRTRSELRVTGDLAGRRLLAPLTLPAWASTELLSNSVVQAVVEGDGRVLTAVLLAGSGHPEADRYALETVQGARFEPAASSHAPRGQGLTRGVLVFQWHTVPPASEPELPKP